MAQRIQWGRILAEGVVIVGSILVAFLIDAWWEDREEQRALGSLAVQLQADILRDLDEMEHANARADSILEALNATYPWGLPDAAAPSADSVLDLAPWLFRGSSFTPTLSVVDLAAGDGAWKRMPQSIRVRLSDYVRGPVESNLDLGQTALETLYMLLSEHGGFDLLAPQPDGSIGDVGRLIAFINDPQVRTWTATHWAMVTSEREWRAQWLQELADIADELASMSDG